MVPSQGPTTIFDRILSGEIPAEKVFEDDDVLAFKDIHPQAPVHVLVIPKRKVSRFAELKNWPVDQIGILFKKAALVAEQLGLEQKGYRVVINNGSDGGQEVEYLHIHILGGRPLNWPPG